MVEQQREYNKNTDFVPREELIHPENPFNKSTVFRTTDKEIYIRDGISGTIKRNTPKIKGKAAKRLAKRNRRSFRKRQFRNKPEHKKVKETTEELIARLKGMMK